MYRNSSQTVHHPGLGRHRGHPSWPRGGAGQTRRADGTGRNLLQPPDDAEKRKETTIKQSTDTCTVQTFTVDS